MGGAENGPEIKSKVVGLPKMPSVSHGKEKRKKKNENVDD